MASSYWLAQLESPAKELWLHRILALLRFPDVCAFGSTNKGWRALARQQAVWKLLQARDLEPK